jgi:hypothetical protein
LTSQPSNTTLADRVSKERETSLQLIWGVREVSQLSVRKLNRASGQVIDINDIDLEELLDLLSTKGTSSGVGNVVV